MSAVYAKLAIGFFLVGCFLFLRDKKPPAMPLLINFMVKAGCFFALYHIAGLKHTSDLTGYYLPQGLNVLNGEVPHRDFTSSYGTLFPYLFGYTYKLLGLDGWYVLLICADTAILWMLLRFARQNQLNNTHSEQPNIHAIFWFWLTNPLIFWNVIVNGQQQILIALFGLYALLGIRHKFAGPSILALGALLTKVMAFIYAPALVLKGNTKQVFYRALLLASILAIYVGSHHFLNIDFLGGLKHESELISPGSILFWFKMWLGNQLPTNMATLIAMFLASGAAAWLYLQGHGHQNLTAAITTVTLLIFFAMGPRVYATYYILALPFILITFCDNTADQNVLRISMACSALAPVEVSYYFAAGRPTILADAKSTQLLSLLVLDTLLIVCHMFIAYKVFRKQRSATL